VIVPGLLLMLALVFGVGMIYAEGVLPGVQVAGVSLGGLSQAEAVKSLSSSWDTVILQDDGRQWTVNPALLGITLDAETTASHAYEQGRSAGNALESVLGTVEIAPVIHVDYTVMGATLAELAPRFELAPVNAGVQFVNGRVEATPAQSGRALDIGATVAGLQQIGAQALLDSVIDLAMVAVPPAVTDTSPLVAEAALLLGSAFDLRAYDPITDNSAWWSLPPGAWASWLTAVPDAGSPFGLALAVEDGAVRDTLTAQANNTFDPSRYIDIDAGVEAVREAISSGRTDAFLRVYHHDRQHTVGSGESFATIAYDYGVPYPWIQAVNPGVTSLAVGQVITVPSPDKMLPLPVVPDKRIVVSISEQRVRVYEQGRELWHWATSTGIASSPTSPGIFQIRSHEPNAYASIWNLSMPNFMGVYTPVPEGDLMNGFHGFPTRGNSQLLWTNDLGHPVTYGCILLSNENAQMLYNWAEEGVVVEITR
jgi:lipoprotein-anchoring transpeptidase ErfK/SrfK